jgi:hypothetical protein
MQEVQLLFRLYKRKALHADYTGAAMRNGRTFRSIQSVSGQFQDFLVLTRVS